MRRFTRLFCELDQSNRTGDKVECLVWYFREAPPADAAWALWFLLGNRLKSPVKARALREWTADLSGLPAWLGEESYATVGDLAETLSLLLPEPGPGTELSLCRLVEDHLVSLQDWQPEVQFQLLRRLWEAMDADERFLVNKLLTGGFRVGVSRSLVVRALAQVAGVEGAVMEHRLMGQWQPSAERFRSFLEEDGGEDDAARPYPFFLASPLEGEVEELGPREEWIVEWKWDGIRAQLIRRQGEIHLWSRGEEMITEAFPEIALEGSHLPDGLVLDGELLAWEEGSPRSFEILQRRLGRKKLGAEFLRENPVAFLAYDLLELGGREVRSEPLVWRRERLQEILSEGNGRTRCFIGLSGECGEQDWGSLRSVWETARDRGVEGFILKRRTSPYRAGRTKGDWWKWKVDPLTIDAVMIYAQAGHGRRATQFTDYTLAVWDGEELTPVAKAYSGLTLEEIAEVDRFVKANTLKKHGPVRVVKPELVFELAFDGIRESGRHRSGIAMRFPRIRRWRRDKRAGEADTLDQVRSLLPEKQTGSP